MTRVNELSKFDHNMISVSPAIRLIFLLTLNFILFLGLITSINNYSSMNSRQDVIEKQKTVQINEQNNYRIEALKKLNESVQVSQNNESMERIKPEDMIKLPQAGISSDPSQKINRQEIQNSLVAR